MASYTSNLTSKLSKEIHKTKYTYRHNDENYKTCRIKYKYCDCFLEYANCKDDLLE